MTRLERFRLAIVKQGFTGVVCTKEPCGCDPVEDFAPCEGANAANGIIEHCRGGYKHFDPSGMDSRPIFTKVRRKPTQKEFDEIASRV